MSNKYQYGRDLSSLVKSGMILDQTMARIRELNVPIEESLMMHNLYESSGLKNKKWLKIQINKNITNLNNTLRPKIIEINELIAASNKLVKGLDFDNEIPKIKVSEITQIVRNRLNSMYKLDAQKVSNQHFHMQLHQILQQPADAIKKFIAKVDGERYEEELGKLGESYKEGMRQALFICSIGFYSTSVFVAGKTMEELINDYCSLLVRSKKLRIPNLSKMNFDSKVGFLHSKQLLSDELYHNLSSIRIARNTFGHPGKGLLDKKQAHLKIRAMIDLVPEIEKRILKLKQNK